MKAKFIPTMDQLIQDVTAIFIDESLNDYDYIHGRVKYHLDEMFPDNVKGLTYEAMISKYRSHIDMWNRRNAEKEKKGFLGRPEANRRKNFLEFLEARMYKIDWDAQSGTPIRDVYLFGTVRMEHLTSQRVKFMESLKLPSND